MSQSRQQSCGYRTTVNCRLLDKTQNLKAGFCLLRGGGGGRGWDDPYMNQTGGMFIRQLRVLSRTRENQRENCF